ncbi:MAG TPA: hypothetical protein VIU65_03915 [Pyrinomonadaceae bacterium]
MALIAFSSPSSFAQTAGNATSPGHGFTAGQDQLVLETPGKRPTMPADVNRNRTTRTERRVFVRSKSLLVRGAVVEDKLLKRPEFHELGFALTRDESDADLILELRHDLFTKYVFSVVDTRSQLVLLSGKLSSLGGTVAGKVARRFVKEIGQTPGP